MTELRDDDAVNEAMARYASGDDLAFEAVYAAVAPRVHAIAIRALGDQMMAEDIVQQTLLNIHRARGSFCPGSPLMPWAYAIARRLIVDLARRRKRQRWLARREVSQQRRRRSVSPDEVLMAHETAGSLRAAMSELPDAQQTVLHLRARGFSLSRMASSLGTTVTAVKLRLHRAMGSLKTAVARPPKREIDDAVERLLAARSAAGRATEA